jgi:hypothetical protein
MRRTVMRAHGQCPASQAPRTVRQNSSQRNVPAPGSSPGDSSAAVRSAWPANPAAIPATDQPTSTSGYSRRGPTRSARNPKTIDPAANAYPKHPSISPIRASCRL